MVSLTEEEKNVLLYAKECADTSNALYRRTALLRKARGEIMDLLTSLSGARGASPADVRVVQFVRAIDAELSADDSNADA